MEAGNGAGDAAPPRRTRRRQVLQGAASLALVVAIFAFVLPKVADLSEVWAIARAMTALEVATLVLAAVWNVATYSFVWTACLPGLTYAQAAVASEASTSVTNTVPGGSYLAIGLTYAMFHSWGFRRSVVTLALLISGVWNNFAKLALPVVALALFALGGQASAGRITAGLAGIAALLAAVAIFAMALRSEEVAARVGNRLARVASWFTRLVGRPPAVGWDVAVTRFRSKTIGLLRRRWHWMTLATLVSHLSLYLVLLLALRHVGVGESGVSWTEVLAAFSFARLVTAIPLTPGGLGVVELALAGALVAAGGARAQVVAAVLVYRVLTYLLPIPIGVGAYLFWRRNRSWRPEVTPSSPLPAEAARP
ncbi:MAG: flippase-like domain-containing protein [Actinomycetota bacterium]|nr:flippase-like domain-containing protein [Actinomycetota bacterium]